MSEALDSSDRFHIAETLMVDVVRVNDVGQIVTSPLSNAATIARMTAPGDLVSELGLMVRIFARGATSIPSIWGTAPIAGVAACPASANGTSAPHQSLGRTPPLQIALALATPTTQPRHADGQARKR